MGKKVFGNIGDRMKGYESVAKTRLVKRTPVAIRIDGCHFHTFLKGWIKPFDPFIQRAMEYTTLKLCEHIQGCVYGYTQSDEITLILCDYQTLNTDAWFDNEVQKICSVSASMASMYFNQFLKEQYYSYLAYMEKNLIYVYDYHMNIEDWGKYKNIILNSIGKGGYFDARCFNIPREEVTNLVYWRQLDCMRNSILSVGQATFSPTFLQGRSCNQIIQDLQEKVCCKNWEDYTNKQKYGIMVYRDDDNKWVTGSAIILIGENRQFLESRITFDN